MRIPKELKVWISQAPWHRGVSLYMRGAGYLVRLELRPGVATEGWWCPGDCPASGIEALLLRQAKARAVERLAIYRAKIKDDAKLLRAIERKLKELEK